MTLEFGNSVNNLWSKLKLRLLQYFRDPQESQTVKTVTAIAEESCATLSSTTIYKVLSVCSTHFTSNTRQHLEVSKAHSQHHCYYNFCDHIECLKNSQDTNSLHASHTIKMCPRSLENCALKWQGFPTRTKTRIRILHPRQTAERASWTNLGDSVDPLGAMKGEKTVKGHLGGQMHPHVLGRI